MPQTGKRVVELMGCGDWGASKCSAKQWFGFMGNVTSAEQIPFQINYKPQPSGKMIEGWKPLNPRVIPCSQSIDVRIILCEKNVLKLTNIVQGIQPACSCVDCQSSCPKPPEFEPVIETFEIFEFNIINLMIFLTYVVGSLVFVAYATAKKKIIKEVEAETESQPSWTEKISASMEEKLRKIFTRWGIFCATHPWMVLFAGE